jgi:hypothetical protein
MQRNVKSLQLQGRSSQHSEDRRSIFEEQPRLGHIPRPIPNINRRSSAMHQEEGRPSQSIFQQGDGRPPLHQDQDIATTRRSTVSMPRATASTISNNFQAIPFDSRGVDNIFGMDCDFLDEELNDIPIETFPEEPHSEEQNILSEDNEVESESQGYSQLPEFEEDLPARRHRKGPQPNKNGNWSSKNLEMALNNIDEGMPI